MSWFSFERIAGHPKHREGKTGAYVCNTEASAKDLAELIRKQDGVNARIYQRDIKAAGLILECWVVVGSMPKNGRRKGSAS